MRIKNDALYLQALTYYPGLNVPLITEILSFNYAPVQFGRYATAMHLHHFHQLDIILDGELTVRLKDQSVHGGKTGDAWLIPPLVWHQLESKEGFRQASFKFSLAPRFWPLFGKEFCRFTVSPALLECLEKAGQRGAHQAPVASQQMASVAALCLVECIDKMAPRFAPDDQWKDFHSRLWPLLEKIQREPGDGWTVQRMAAECHLSQAHFSRCFHRVVQQTPQQYVRETRLKNSAAELLATPQLSIKEIARHAGYANVQAFTHAFSAIFHISPAAYRQQAAKEME